MIGTHKARAKEWALGMSGSGENAKEQIVVLFQIVGGECDGRSITWYGFFTDKTVDRTLDSLRHCGWQGDNIGDLTGLDANEVEIVIVEDEYKGRTKLKVAWVNRPTALALNRQMTPADVQAFAARLRGCTVAHKQKYKQAPSPRTAPQQQRKRASGDDSDYGSPPPADDDVPF